MQRIVKMLRICHKMFLVCFRLTCFFFFFHSQTDRQTDICLSNSGNKLYSEALKVTTQKKNCQNKYRNIKTSSLSNFQLHFSIHYDPKQVRAIFQCLSQTFLGISSMIDHKSFSDSLLALENGPRK